ncbi:hypothetical protein A1O1_02580 [Capronia coronata CBS 617.96]|uniref:ADF-H domain-containing protein n=1 Tax=Capronia coronata CBS 617.96 TaxID=1182541 RepID=W9YMN8_9EURO|nr:uncharacterized protein A1O1_02580 [Capronia coronata CBS 617.96]EXJ94187.1 hypothetical protein A1O1_02580 [Capronia coronata CBS 617.96]
MSLNGLDGTAVAEAHQAALAEAGGWFLLSYINRDTVELLKKGTGGIQEVRNVIEQYEEKSPLYGWLQYRRKKVILKYVPEGTSRLLQVRLTVQFQSVLETFSPHDTVFSFTAASELTDSALGLNKMVLPSAASLTSSNSSLRRRRLDEITEDAEEATWTADEMVTMSALPEEPMTPTYGRRELDELPASAVLAKALLAKRKEEAVAAAASTKPDSATILQPETTAPLRKDNLAPRAPAASELPSLDKSLPATPEESPPATGDREPAKAPDFDFANNILLDAAATISAAEPLTPRPHTHHLSAAESDSISQWNNHVASYATVKSKKKLGPRPHVDAAHRPKTSGTFDIDVNGNVRPVANLPTTVRVSTRSVVGASLRPGSQQSTRSVPGRFAPLSHSIKEPPRLPSPTYLQSVYKPSESRPTLLRPASTTTEGSAATPDKLRLMKALQLRKRNMLLAQRASTATSSAPLNANTHNESDSSVSPYASSSHLSSLPSQEQLANIDEESKLAQSSSTTSPTFTTNISEELSTKASSVSEQEAGSRKPRSLSSGTSSSITPKAIVINREDILSSADAFVDDSAAGLAEGEIANPAQNEPTQSMVHAASIEVERPLDRDASTVVPSSASSAQVQDEQDEDSPTTADASQSRTNGIAPLSKQRRQAPTEPLRILPSGDTSTSDMSEDEALMEELQNATVHEAKPVSVARSPVTPIMSQGSSDKLRDFVNKTSTSNYQARQSARSTPDRKSSASIRSVSTALPQWPPVQAEPALVPLTKKPTLGSGISKRIKALEVLTTKDTQSLPPPPPVRVASGGRAAFSAFLKRSAFIPNQQSPNMSTEKSPPKPLPFAKAHYESDPSNLASTALQRPLNDDRGPVQKGDSISVTARIVRDNSGKRPPMSPSSSYHTPLNLFRSPLIVEHEKHDELPHDVSLTSMQSLTMSPTKSEKSRFSFSSHRSASQTNLPRSESNTSKLSYASAHKKHGPRSTSDAASSYEEKPKGSRTSRLMKRMSNLTSPRNKNHPSKEPAQPITIQEQSELTRHDSASESLLHVVDIGDVNVQFPETLLWKRRFMRVDDQGYLIFSPAMTDANMKSVSRKYHLSDFKRLSLPDLGQEEMAWSILLDLKDGRCIQCACEGRHAQQQVLRMLVDAHHAYHQLYGNSK